MTAPSEIDLALYEPEFDHALCQAEADLYGAAYCLATRKPGPCLGQHRPGTILAPPTPVKVPVAPIGPTPAQVQQARMQDAGYQQAYLAAQRVAVGAGLAGARHGEVVGAMHDYAQALHGHQQAEARAATAQQAAQKAHDSAVARNQAQQVAYAAREAAAQARAKAQVARAHLHRKARAAAVAPPPGFATDDYGVPLDFELYGLVSWAHRSCYEGEFCRNPLHPGPCKGWKHMLHSVAPGAYHAYEQQRVAKLNEKRKAKIEALQKLGHPVPKHLLQPITYAQVPKAPAGTPFVAPTPKEAISKLPATAKEIGAKIGMKHAALAEAKKGAQIDAAHQVLANIAQAVAPDSFMAKIAGSPVVKGKIAKAVDELAPGQKLSEHKVLSNTIGMLAEKASQAAGGLSAKDKAAIASDIAAHVDQGIPEVPLTVTSAINLGKAKEVAAQAESQGATLHNIAVAVESAGKGQGAKAAFVDAIKNAHAAGAPVEEPTKAPGMGSVISHLANKIGKVLTPAYDKAGKKGPGISVIHQQISDHVNQGKPGLPPVVEDMLKAQKGELFPAKPELSAKEIAAAQAKEIAATQAKEIAAAQAKEILATQGMSLTTKAGRLSKTHFDAMPSADQDKLIAQLKDVEADAGPEVSAKAIALIEKFTGEKPKVTGPLAHPDMMKVLDLADFDAYTPPSKMIAAFQAPGVTKAEYDKLPPAAKDKIKAAVAKMWDYSPPNAQLVAHELGLGHPALLDQSDVPGADVKKSLAPHVQAAQSIATGSAYMTDTKKVAAYGKLSADEYHSLPPDVQAKIHDHLQAAHAKFVSPAKKKQVQDILTKLGAPGAGSGAGAPHGTSVHAAEAEKYVKGWDAAKTLASGSGISDHEAAAASVQHAGKLGQMAAHEEMVTKGLSQQWADTHLSDLPLSQHEKDAIKAKVKAEISQMLHSGAEQPEPGGVLDFGAGFSAHGGTPAKKASLYKNIVGIGSMEPVGAGAGGPGAAGAAEKYAKGHVGALKYIGINSAKGKNDVKKDWADGAAQSPEDTATGLADVWREMYLDHLTNLNADQVDALTKQAENEFLDMIHNGKVSASKKGLLYQVHHGTLEPAELGQVADGLIGGHSSLPKYAQGEVTPIRPSVPSGPKGLVETYEPLKGTVAQQAAKHHAGYKAASVLSGGQGSKTTPADIQAALKDGTFPTVADKMAAGIGKLWATQHTDATTAEKTAAVAEIKHMILAGEDKPPTGGVLDSFTKDTGKPSSYVSSEPLGAKAAGESAHGVGSASATTVTSDPHEGYHQLVVSGHEAGVESFNAKVKGAKTGQAGLKQAALSISKIDKMGPGTKFGPYSAESVSNALKTYSASEYDDINRYLRKRAAGEAVSSPKYDKIAKAIQAAMGKSKLTDSVVVYRGVKTGKKTFGEHFSSDKSMVGAEITAAGLVSTSTSRGVAQSFAGYGGTGMVMRIVVPKGSKAVSLIGGYHSHEDELLLPDGVKLRVVADNGYQNGYRQLDLEVVG